MTVKSIPGFTSGLLWRYSSKLAWLSRANVKSVTCKKNPTPNLISYHKSNIQKDTQRKTGQLTIPSIFEVNCPPHCCLSFVRILFSWSSLALRSKSSRRASFFLWIKNNIFVYDLQIHTHTYMGVLDTCR